jgi:hypothetical protein
MRAYKAITSSVQGVLARRRGERDEVRRGAERHPLRSKPQDDLPRGACALFKIGTQTDCGYYRLAAIAGALSQGDEK